VLYFSLIDTPLLISLTSDSHFPLKSKAYPLIFSHSILVRHFSFAHVILRSGLFILLARVKV
jgi:hypothetical protein